jgi:hypothetical protein
VLSTAVQFRPFGASGVHARLEGDVRAGSRLLPFHRLTIVFIVVALMVTFPSQPIVTQPRWPRTALRSSLAEPLTIAIAIGSRG